MKATQFLEVNLMAQKLLEVLKMVCDKVGGKLCAYCKMPYLVAVVRGNETKYAEC